MPSEKRFRVILVVLAFILFSIIVIGLTNLARIPATTASVTLAYIAGLSMIILPCTLPLVFIIVPLTMGHSPKKGLGMALLFGLGLTVTIGFYGVATGVVGGYLGLDKATRIMFTIAGLAALLFGLSELKLIKWNVPGIHIAMPGFIEKRKDYAKSFFMGLFLGNAGIGCPNPAFYVLLVYIASIGSAFTGGWLGIVHGIGRATPLIFFAILGILGINSTIWLMKRRLSIDKIMGWGLLGVGGFILSFGLYGMSWWETSIFHVGWNNFVLNIAPNLAELPGHELLVPSGFIEGPVWLGWVTFIAIIILGIIWYKLRKKPMDEVQNESASSKHARMRKMRKGKGNAGRNGRKIRER